jgi:hypothetical protein
VCSFTVLLRENKSGIGESSPCPRLVSIAHRCVFKEAGHGFAPWTVPRRTESEISRLTGAGIRTGLRCVACRG